MKPVQIDTKMVPNGFFLIYAAASCLAGGFLLVDTYFHIHITVDQITILLCLQKSVACEYLEVFVF